MFISDLLFFSQVKTPKVPADAVLGTGGRRSWYRRTPFRRFLFGATASAGT